MGVDNRWHLGLMRDKEVFGDITKTNVIFSLNDEELFYKEFNLLTMIKNKIFFTILLFVQ